jgi:predicted O-methyltransferase YrrM
LQLVDPDIERYSLEHTSPLPAWLEQLEARARAELPHPEMLSGPVVGRLLELLVHATQARRVLEIGTYAGCSALAIAAGLPGDGRILTCEISPEHAAYAREQIAASPYAERIEVILGDALQTIRGLEGPFDFVFIDADKEGYPAYVEAALPLLSPHGLIAMDNTLRYGRVLEGSQAQEEGARVLAELNQRLARDERLTCTLLTVRDGITLIRRR